MYTLYKFHFLNGISEINQLFDDILIIWPAPVYMHVCMHVCTKSFLKTTTNSSCVCTHLANKADSDSDSDSD